MLKKSNEELENEERRFESFINKTIIMSSKRKQILTEKNNLLFMILCTLLHALLIAIFLVLSMIN